MPSGSRFMLCLVASFFVSGCAGNDLLLKRQSEAEAKIEFLLQSSKKADQRHNELSALLQAHEDRFTSGAAEMKLLKDESRELRASHEEVKARVAVAVQQLQTPKVEIVNQPSAPKAASESGPPDEYLKAFGLYSANNFQGAIESFSAFIKNNPQSEFVANALYWIGECHYTRSDLTKAQEIFSRVVDNYPKSPKAPDAMLKLGYTYAALKEKEKATALFEKIVTTFPSSSAATKARERISAH